PPLKEWQAKTFVKVAPMVVGRAAKYLTLLSQAQMGGKLTAEQEAELEALAEEMIAETQTFTVAMKQGIFRCVALFYSLFAWFTSGDAPELVLAAV
ncbi:MAG: hypothetical protein RL616_2362, partial [Verrucomicrobiota bacterium]